MENAETSRGEGAVELPREEWEGGVPRQTRGAYMQLTTDPVPEAKMVIVTPHSILPNTY